MESIKRGRHPQGKLRRNYTLDRSIVEYIDSLSDGDRSRFVNKILAQGILAQEKKEDVSSTL